MSDTRIDDLLDELVPPFAPSGHGWDDVLARAQSVRRRYALVAVAAFALALVPTAIAFRGRITDLFRGTPAPPAVTTSFEANNRIADLATQKGFGDKFPRVDVSRIRGLLEIQTADGPQDVWAAPNELGGTCWFVDWAKDAAPNGVQPGQGACGHIERDGSLGVNYGWDIRHPTLETLFGQADARADRLVVELKDGSRDTVPVVEGVFLASFPNGTQLERITAYSGHERVGTWQAPSR